MQLRAHFQHVGACSILNRCTLHGDPQTVTCRYAHSFKARFRNLFGAQQLPSNYEENDSVITARRRVGLESSKMDYMEKVSAQQQLVATTTGGSGPQAIRHLQALTLWMLRSVLTHATGHVCAATRTAVGDRILSPVATWRRPAACRSHSGKLWAGFTQMSLLDPTLVAVPSAAGWLLVQLLEAAKSSASDAQWQDLNAMYDKVVAALLQLLYTFRDPANLWALAVRLQHHERPSRPTSTHCCSGAAATLLLQQWDQGQELQQQLLQAEQLRAAAQQEVDRLLRENDSRWFGDQSGGKLRRVELNGRELLTLVCVAPSSPALGSYAVSHLEGAAEKAFWPLDNAYLRGLARVNKVLLAPIAPVLRLSSKWSVGEAIWNSDIEAVPVPALRLSGLDVVRVDVLEGTIDGGPMVLQIKLHCSDNSVIQVPNCDESELFEVSRKPWVSNPQPGVSGKVVAVSGQGHALKFHWVSKP